MRRATLIAAITAVALAGTAIAQQQNVNVRGTIAALDGNKLSVKTKAGSDVTVELPESVNVATTAKFSLADVKPGMVLGVTTVKRPDGSIVAIDVRPVPPTAPLGLSSYDLQPGSTMTNATLEGAAAEAPSGHELTLNYKSGTVKVLVPPDTPMSRAVPGSRADLKPGETVYVAARKGDGDTLTAVRVQVSKDGVKPTQ